MTAMETSDDELLDLLTCHRPDSCPQILYFKSLALYALLMISMFLNPTSWSTTEQWSRLFLKCGFLSEASLGPYAWEAVMKRKVVDVPPKKYPAQKASCIKRDSPVLKVYSYAKASRHPDCQLDDDIKDLERTREIFLHLDRDPVLSYKLPPPHVTAGKILHHACSVFHSLLDRWQPMTFKFGITHCPSWRWHNTQYGYKFSRDPFQELLVVYVAGNPHGPAFLEAALIEKFGSYLVATNVAIDCLIQCFATCVEFLPPSQLRTVYCI